ncbi:MAG: hypothetical protein QM530_07380 [Phycisphaerales bacterium]|nr:hypothetical protein [Phycisphaerales bacterium]
MSIKIKNTLYKVLKYIGINIAALLALLLLILPYLFPKTFAEGVTPRFYSSGTFE